MKDQNPNFLRTDLAPYLEMLEEKGRTLSRAEWDQMIQTTVERIASAPEQYLRGNLRPTAELQQAIRQVFEQGLN